METLSNNPKEISNIVISLRATERERNFIDRAAQTLGKTRTEFMLESSRREAESVLLDRVQFAVDENIWNRFIEELDRPPSVSEGLKKLLSEKAPWE